MRIGDRFAAGQVGDRACDFQHAVIAAGRQAELFHGAFQQSMTAFAQDAVAVDLARTQAGIGLAAALQLAAACRNHTPGNCLAGFAVRCAAGPQHIMRQPGHFDMQIDAIQQRPRDPRAVTLNLVAGAMAAAGRIAEIPARAGIHGRDQLKPRGELCLPGRPRYHDTAGFQRFAQDFERVPVEFG